LPTSKQTKRLSYDYEIVYRAHLANEIFLDDMRQYNETVNKIKKDGRDNDEVKELTDRIFFEFHKKYPHWAGGLCDDFFIKLMQKLPSDQWVFFTPIKGTGTILRSYDPFSPVNIIKNAEPLEEIKKLGVPFFTDSAYVLFHNRIPPIPSLIVPPKVTATTSAKPDIVPGRFLRIEVDLSKNTEDIMKLTKWIIWRFKEELNKIYPEVVGRNRKGKDMKHIENYIKMKESKKDGISAVTKSDPKKFSKKTIHNAKTWEAKQRELNRSKKRVEELFKELELPTNAEE